MVIVDRTPGRELSRRAVLAGGATALLAGCHDGGAPTSLHHDQMSAKVDWSRLRRSVQGRLVLPSDRGYDRVRLTQNPRYDGQRPLAVLSVANGKDVATALAFAQDQDIPVAVRSGGHSYPGWSGGGSPRSLVVDVRPLDRVKVHGTTATVGSGAALAHLYDGVSRKGRAVAAGSCPTVGVAGLTLGGGVGVLSRAYGLTCDFVTGMKVVTADGRILRVDADHEPDLFWALRGGGGGHLGVVTAFTMRTVAAPTVRTAYLQWPASAAPAVLEAWQAWAPEADARLWSTCKLLAGTKHPGGPVVAVAATWTGPAAAFERRLRGLLAHVPPPPVSTRATRTYREAMFTYAGCSSVPATQCHTGPGGALKREALSATSHVAYDAIGSAAIGTLLDRLEDAPRLREVGVLVDALGGRVADVAPDATAFVHREALATVQYTATYPPGTPRRADRFVRGLRRAMTPYWGDHAYVNYADPTIADHRNAYFGTNANRLAEVRAAYDPDRFFTQPQSY